MICVIFLAALGRWHLERENERRDRVWCARKRACIGGFDGLEKQGVQVYVIEFQQ
jgi:hypothetical protein